MALTFNDLPDYTVDGDDNGQFPILDLNDANLTKWNLCKSFFKQSPWALGLYRENVTFLLPTPAVSSPSSDVDIASALLREHTTILKLDPDLGRWTRYTPIGPSPEDPLALITTIFNATEPSTCRFHGTKPHNMVYKLIDTSGGVDIEVVHPGKGRNCGCHFTSKWRIVPSPNGSYIQMEEMAKVVLSRPLAAWYKKRIMKRLSNIREALSKKLQSRMDTMFPPADHSCSLLPGQVDAPSGEPKTSRAEPSNENNGSESGSSVTVTGHSALETATATATGADATAITSDPDAPFVPFTASQPPTNEWSEVEQNAFPTYVAHFGKDFAAIASHLQTKTPNMVRNFFLRSVDEGKWNLEELAHQVEERKLRGEPLGNPPALDTSLGE